MLDAPHPPAPPDLAERAMERGKRLLRRRRLLHAALWTLLGVAAAAGTVLAVHYWPQPTVIAPPMRGW
ncbi:hypothetical protein NGB36_16765 [Streptomyces sp. RB6PN25]|uniref:Uncharacterized protein n=2 Tax=Streptomyces humicola TaxID=2953240 RepID=A0ABT1PX15_9ACTN|nr:hypothetical protein [Streptomyces humicola]MCQ4082214.1 hypothetical protein [Streptomyces humicola]